MLSAKLCAGNMIVLDAIYHAKCCTATYNKANRIQLGDDFDNMGKRFHGVALAKLAASIEEAFVDSENKNQGSKINRTV